jgi:hypothetical protein
MAKFVPNPELVEPLLQEPDPELIVPVIVGYKGYEAARVFSRFTTNTTIPGKLNIVDFLNPFIEGVLFHPYLWPIEFLLLVVEWLFLAQMKIQVMIYLEEQMEKWIMHRFDQAWKVYDVE